MRKRGRPPADDLLTPAEWRVVEGIRHGLSNPRIARLLGVGVDAVKYHVANILAKLALRDRRQLRHWSGVRRASALHHRSLTMSEPETLGAIGQIARTVSDVAAAEVWYRDVLGLPHLYTFGKLCFFDCAGTRLLLSEGEGGAAQASILYFRVADIHAAHARLAALGVVFLGAPHLIHRHADGVEEWMAFFNDPEQRPLALMAQVRA